jgi:hypothetical protein
MLFSELVHRILCNLLKPLLIEFESDFAHLRTFLPERLLLAEISLFDFIRGYFPKPMRITPIIAVTIRIH